MSLCKTIFVAFACCCLLPTSTLLAADDDKDDKKDETQWVQLMTTTGSNGGKVHFKVAEDAKVKFAWDVQPTGGSTSFRITVSKKHERTGNYQTLATIFKTNTPSKKHLVGKLAKGDYQLYLAVRRMNYTVTVYAEKK